MSIKKLEDIADDWAKQERCYSHDHQVPSHISLKPGVYEHVCSGCGKRTVFSVRGVRY